MLAASAIQAWLRNGSVEARKEIERACLLTKSTEWGYEDEYRLLGTTGVQDSVASFRSITFGLKCAPALQYATIAALGGKNSLLEFFQIVSPGVHFELTREPIDLTETFVGMPRINLYKDFELLDLNLTNPGM
jgi:hypothetical protein